MHIRHSKIRLFFVSVMVLALASCLREEDFPDIPVIQYHGFQKIYNPELELYDRGVISISYKDGNGDIGLAPGDTFPPFDPDSKYYHNLLIDYYEFQNGTLKKVPIVVYNSQTQEFDTLSLSARVPMLTPAGNNKAISGEIRDTIFIYNFSSPFDTIRFDVTLVDRSLNESNTISTPLIIRD